MFNNGSSSAGDNKDQKAGLRRAVTHVNSLWFPINVELLERVKAGLSEGKYDLDLEFLINDLKGDLALFTYTIKGLCEIIEREQGNSSFGELSVRALFDSAGIARIQKVLAVPANQITRHATNSSTNSQVETVEAALISASAAELLAERTGVDGVDSYSSAVLRQLGLTLIAYNYPTAFRKALASTGGGKDLDISLSEQLGFSPILLASAVVQQWRPLSRAIRFAVGGERALNPEELPRSAEAQSAAQAIQKLCEVGEALVRASAPARYPTAANDWKKAKEYVESTLGHDGLHKIAEKVRENCSGYVKLFPGMMERAQNFSPELKLHEHQSAELVAQNPLISQCLPPLKIALTELYAKLESGIEVKESLQHLVSRVIPVSGFTSGAVFTLDPTLNALVPRLKFGQTELRKIASIQLGGSTGASDCVTLGFTCNAPIVENYQLSDENEVGLVCGAIGVSQVIGVLYVEYPYAVLKELSGGALVHFKAIREALNDCLRLK